MIGAYGWAFVKPIRKLYYNLTITFVSVVVALIVGGVEAIGLLKDQLNLTGGVWDFIGSLNDNFSTLGFVIIGVFALSWVGSVIIYCVKRLTGLNRQRRQLINLLLGWISNLVPGYSLKQHDSNIHTPSANR